MVESGQARPCLAIYPIRSGKTTSYFSFTPCCHYYHSAYLIKPVLFCSLILVPSKLKYKFFSTAEVLGTPLVVYGLQSVSERAYLEVGTVGEFLILDFFMNDAICNKSHRHQPTIGYVGSMPDEMGA